MAPITLHPFLLQIRQLCTFNGIARFAVMLWLLALISTIPFPVLSFVEKVGYYDDSMVDICRTHIQLAWHRGYVILTILIFFVLPLIVLFVVYGLICQKLIIQSKDENLSANPRSSSTLKSRRQVVIMLVIVAILFFICLLPFKVVSLWLIYASVEDVESLGLEGYLNLLNFARIMHYLNSSINPIVYNLVSTKFRKYFHRSMKCCERHAQRDSHYLNDYSTHRSGSTTLLGTNGTMVESMSMTTPS